MTIDQENGTGITTLGGGCFWCLEAVYQDLQGILKVESGYAGGSVDHPTYRQVTGGTTGHAEVVQLTFDPDQVSFREILEVFFTIHDPTTLNRQGADVGPQYRSAIFFHTPEQEQIANQVIREMEAAKLWPNPIVTEVTPFTNYFPAEEYHQNYYRDNSRQPYCQIVIAPKVAKFRQKYMAKLRQG